MSKRISFNQHDAADLYEWRLAVKQCIGEDSECAKCVRLEKRLRDFIGQKEAKWLQRQVRKNPYHKINETNEDISN